MRVGTLPRTLTKFSWDNLAGSAARKNESRLCARRGDDVRIDMTPVRSTSLQRLFGTNKRSRASARGNVATTSVSAVSSIARSFHECTTDRTLAAAVLRESLA